MDKLCVNCRKPLEEENNLTVEERNNLSEYGVCSYSCFQTLSQFEGKRMFIYGKNESHFVDRKCMFTFPTEMLESKE